MAIPVQPDETIDYYDGQYESLKVGLCQIYTEEWTVEDNLRRTIEAMEAAANKGAEIAVTPECVLHGNAIKRSDDFLKQMRDVAEPLDGKNLRLLCQKAQQLNIFVLIGFAERGDNEIYNSAALISNEGKIISVYRKVHCRPFEDIHHDGAFTPGSEFVVNTLTFGDRQFKVGTMICFDREITESVRCLRSLGAEIIFCPLATNTYDMTRYKNSVDNEAITCCRAAENEVFIAVVNHSGNRDWSNGGSFVVGPKGELMCQMKADSGVCVVDVPVGVVRKKFHSNPLGWMGWGFRRQQIYGKYLK